ncbi:flagellar motor switch phosphatase FliY [Salicibibacter halophilus]|uniref:Flagellar motor switch phosphatase FliY n=1 Tax=Salicibibacter halophilus TaxID=2502791 RepID=A0A514LEM3_9BACI|nr:flagellar motor switch phosphatase FliY [Salicibibacter halophilus]QDI90290.1 flagellar motor switch phosphatase FliY [Salicibibacter halophilus]
MNDHGEEKLSQEEINRLLEGFEDGGEETKVTDIQEDGYPPPTTKAALDVNHYLTGIEQDTLGEIGNISFGSAATALSELIKQKVEITTPIVQAIEFGLLHEEFPVPHVAVHVKYTHGFKGTNLLVIKEKDARIIADLMLGGDGSNPASELSDMHISAVQEAMNQMMGSSSTSLSTIFDLRVNISPPSIDLLDTIDGSGTEELSREATLIKISFRLRVGDMIDSTIMQLATVSFAKEMVTQLLHSSRGDKEEEHSTAPPKLGSESAKERAIRADGEREAGSVHAETSKRNVQPVAFHDFDEAGLQAAEAQNLNMLMDIPLDVTVELGRTSRSIKEILQFTQGSIIELDKLAGEPVDILVNQRLVAKGEVVVIDENFGVRVTDIASREQRMQHLKND